MASHDRLKGFGAREAPPVLIIIGVVVLVIALGTGGYYVFNGGWKTASQQQDDFKHNYQPILAAKHGDMGPFNAENEVRKAHGQELLVIPEEKSVTAGNAREGLEDLRKKLGVNANSSAGQ